MLRLSNRTNDSRSVYPIGLARETPGFTIDVGLEVAWEQHFDPQAWMFQQLVVQQRPYELSHVLSLAVHQIGFIDAIEQYDHAFKAQRAEKRLQLFQECIAVVGTRRTG